jgi:nitrite reductase (NADH) large subunit
VRVGAYSKWRALHGLLGASALAVLLAHTGFRMGHNLNFVLMCAFLLSALTGGAYGLTVAASQMAGSGPSTLRLKSVVQLVHDYAIWPLCLLVGFHVLKVYYF